MKTVKDIVKEKQLATNTINGDAMVVDAFLLMEEKNEDYVVVKDNDQFIGVISGPDFMHKIIIGGLNASKTSVKDIMKRCVHAVDNTETVHHCLGIMDAFKIRHLLVFEGFKFTGVITMHDLMLASLKENTAIPQFQ